MKKIAVFPGSFDPITAGHVDVLERAMPLFDKIIIAIGKNESKKRMFSLEQRMNFIKEAFVTNNKIEVDSYEGLTIDYCKTVGADFILRGIRNTIDLEYEKAIAQANKSLAPNVETVFLITSEKTSFISSSIVREIFVNDGNVSEFLPKGVKLK